MFSFAFPFNLSSRHQTPRENPLIAWAQNNPVETRRIQNFLKTESDRLWAEDCAAELIETIIQRPKDFSQPDRIADALIDGGARGPVFFGPKNQDWKNTLSLKIWTLPAADPRPEAARCAAIFAAEDLRCRLGLKGGQDELPLEKIFDAAANTDPTTTKSAILAVQNALVDHVTEHQGDTSLTRGAAILALLSGDEGSQFWSEKLEDIKTRHVYSDRRGDITKYIPVYAEITPQ
jgi:hypothetical protein